MSTDDDVREIRALLAGNRRTGGADGDAASALERAWHALELPPAAAAPAGFARRVAARAGSEQAAALGLPLSPRLARLAAASAVVAGIAGGIVLGLVSTATASASEGVESDVAWAASSFAEELFDGLAAAAEGEEAAR